MADDDDDDDPVFTGKFNKVFHKAMGEREARFEKKLMKSLDGFLGTKIDELRVALVDTNDDDEVQYVEPHPQNAVPSGSGRDLSPESRAELRQAQKDAKEAKEVAARYQKQYEEEKTQRSRTEERSELVSLLTPHVRPRVLDMVVNQIHGSNVIRDQDTGKILWRGEDGEALPLKDGVSAWAKSEVGKEFAPVVESKGRGGRSPEGGNGYITTTPGKMTIEQVGDIVTGSILK